MTQAGLYDRALRWAHRRSRGRRVLVTTVNLVRNSVEDRIAGLAAEMSFWALLSFLPLLVAIGALLSYTETLVGAEQVVRGQRAIVSAGTVVFSPELTREVVRPFVEGLLSGERGGVAFTSLVIALYLASRVFTATIRSLDVAYRVTERRGLLLQRALAVGFAVGFVILVVATLLLMVLGPLLGSGITLAERLGLGAAAQLAWSVARWPLLVAIMVAFLATVYRWGPNVDNHLRDCLPGAVLGVVLWTLASLGLRLYLAAGGAGTSVVASEEQAVALVGRVVGTMVAMMLWVFVTGLAILLGGELNAELARPPGGTGVVRPQQPSGTMPARD